jgi:putative NADH-flavin reductase
MQQWENMLEANRDIDWICIRPSRLTNGQEKGHYRVELNHSPEGGWQISRADLADFILKQVLSDEYIHQKPAIAY